ncbi:restriction endonuclease subunit S [Salegentibacter mishustinae]|uniref:restriction endonuclease subunit S n=1 Tax=Salegentibacter mishustinae TaxID=270918 RepID=UPI001CE0857D|nr:restriction endonuclease subunit S [Salegentibacter mishustinae]UBZ07251.1 restriction endonuclease subunit S [Salegentibacter mishustinae]
MQELLKYFHELSLHPKNAEELKGLILQLAIQGKLTADWRSRNPELISGEDSVKNLQKNIAKERTKLVKEGVIRKNKKSLPISNDEKFLDIPNEWDWIRIGDLGDFYNGDSINKNVKESKYEGLEEGYPYIGTKDVGYGFDNLIYNNGVRIPYEEIKYKVANPGTVLICSEGGSAGKKCGLVTEKICFGNKLYALEPFGNIESLLILALYQTPAFQDQFKSRMTGIIGGISKNNFRDIPIPIAPLNEQKIISSKVETLFQEVEALENRTNKRIELKTDYATSALNELAKKDSKAEWQALKPQFHTFFNEVDNIKKLRETILQLAVQGKLTEKWRAQNPELISGKNNAENLLKKIKAKKAKLVKEKKIKKEKPLPPITENEIPYELPNGWVWTRLGDSSINLDGHRIPLSKADRAKRRGEFDYYGAQGVIDKIDDFIFNKSLLLIAEDGGNLLRRTKPVAYMAHGKYWVNNHAHVVDTIDESSKLYLEIFLNSIDLSPHLNGQPPMQIKLNRGKLNFIPISLPPLNEQKAIVGKVNDLMKLCDQLETEIETGKKQIEDLMQSVLKEVFEGNTIDELENV